ncbi:response regulator [Prevotella cerevisiae]|uniref:histidine kinase n=1 Tax=Segatella cerevisiae TaxID=2053716 RepID=A0ABT1BUU2_9BACT|nr:two-component regulator propeller domain-containing protein [Segatella cerevisiae]MCO6024550.1 response regulator [Segatella cerevisiae]
MKNKLLILFCLILALFVRADSGSLYTADRLSSSLINCIVQDQRGFIWVGTDYGLSRFDGYRFINYLHNDRDSTSISDNTISAFLVDKKGRLWIGSAKGLMSYDYSHNHFIRLPFPDRRHPRIYSLIEDHKGNVLIGTAGFGLYAVPKGKNRIENEMGIARRDSDIFFTHIFEDNRGTLWQASHLSMINRYTKGNYLLSVQHIRSLYGAPVAFFQFHRDQLFIVCMYGIEIYDYKTGKLRDAGYDFGNYRGNVTINNAIFDHNGNLYLGTSECGVLVSRKGKNFFRPFSIPNKDRFDLSTSFVSDLMEDKDHNIWIGCYKKGLYLINNERTAFHTWSFSYQNYSIGSSVSSLASGDQGRTWCTVQNSGIYCFDRYGKIISHPKSPAGTTIIYRDQKKRYWVGTGNGLYRYNPSTGESQRMLTFSSAGIYCITDNGDDKLYISVYSKGLYIYDIHTRKVKVLDMTQHLLYGHLCNDWIRTMLFDSRGLLWIGTSNGVCCLDPKTYHFDHFGWSKILTDIQSDYFCEDKNGDIIIGTDEGLYLYSVKYGKVNLFPHSESLQNKQICGIIRDHNNDIWVSTTMGIWQYVRKYNRFIGHVSGNGLTAHEYIRGAVLHCSDDFSGFGIADGITTFYPEEVNRNSLQLGKVYLTDFIIDGKTMDCRKKYFKVPYSENSFTLGFSLLTYKNIDDICYQYRINDGKKMYTPIGENTIPFNHLEPGKYVIEVKAFSNSMSSSIPLILTVVVMNPWYSTPLAWCVYLFLFGSLCYFVFRTYRRRGKAQLDEQKMRFLIDATHDIRSPLTLILGPLKKLEKRLTDQENQNDLNIIERNAQRLLLLVNQILDERKLDKEQMHLHCQKTNMSEFIQNICSLYQYNANERKINFHIVSEQSNIEAWIDRINFDKVVSNLLSNAFKYTFNGGEIDVILTKDLKNMYLKVVDNGLGFKEKKTEKLFERFYEGTNAYDLHIAGTGIGLNLCRAIVKMHGGAISAYNRTDGQQGACLEVSLPLGYAHLKPEEIMSDNVEDKQETRIKKSKGTKNFKILVVDDDPEIADYINAELGGWYRFSAARNGKEALEKLLTNDFDLVVSDIIMPEMDGIELLKRIKTNTRISDIPVILLTSKNEVSDRLEGLKKGADAFLAKPFNMEELHILIDNLVSNVRRLRGKFSGAQDQSEKVEKVEVKGNNNVLMERIMKCVNQNLSDPDFNVEKLTIDVGISRAQLHRKMKEITGISTGEFIRNLRMEQAARLIKQGEVNVTQVAYAVGFSNQTHFSSAFKKHFGLAPKEYYEYYRKKNI